MKLFTDEPVIWISIIAAAVVAVLEGVFAGNIDSVEDAFTIAIPILLAPIARQLVTPTAKTKRRPPVGV